MDTNKQPDVSDVSNRTRLLKAATDAFAEHGFEGASLRAIAQSAGVSFQLITHYFGTKSELWLATVDYLHERYFETGKGLGFKLSGNIHAQFHNHLRLLLTDMVQRPQLRKIWVQEYLAGSERYTKVIQPRIKEFYDTISLPYYKEVVRLGIVKKFTAEEMSLLFAGIVQVNVVHPYFIELATGLGTGPPQAIESQIDLLYRILTEEPEDEAEARASAASSLSASAAESGPDGDPVVRAWEARGSDVPATARIKQLEIENNKLKQLLVDAKLESKVLLEMLERARQRSRESFPDE
jgi:AcrR family transcriptional regulator